VNLYAYAGSNPVAFSDPFGLDTTSVACRPVGGDNRAGGGQSDYGHCAIRIKNEEIGIDIMFEITRGPPAGAFPTTLVGAFGPSSENFARYGDKWVPVGVPVGQTVTQFDTGVLREVLTQKRLTDGQIYNPDGKANSNSFVYNSITGAGGKVPAAASAAIKRVLGSVEVVA
jgi:hypothetical protein